MKNVSKPTSSIILAGIQKAMREQKTNPYQIAKASGMPLTTVQRLLEKRINVPLRNVEMLAKALGVTILVAFESKPKAKPGTGRGHGIVKVSVVNRPKMKPTPTKMSNATGGIE
jgi:hypothetical protein